MFSKILVLLLASQTLLVKDVKIENINWWDQQTIINALGIKKGQSISPTSIRSVLKKAYLTDYFDDLYIKATAEGQKADVLVKIRENPKLKEIAFEGLKSLKPSKIKDTLGIKENIPVSDATLFRIKSFILEEYKNKGYYGTEVNTILSEPDEKGHVKISVSVKEGQKARIKEIIFHGNVHFSSNRLKRVMKTKEKKFIIFTGKLNEEKFKEDLNRLKTFYLNNGFPEARIDSFKNEAKEKDLFVHIYITEGKKYYFGDISIEGNEFFPVEELLKRVKIKK